MYEVVVKVRSPGSPDAELIGEVVEEALADGNFVEKMGGDDADFEVIAAVRR